MSGAILRHHRAIWLAVLLLTLGGVYAGMRLPVSLFPHIDYPRVVVAVDSGDRDAAQMATIITRPIEIALRAVPGVTGIRSTTSRGSAEVALSFDWGGDMVASMLATEGALAAILPDLPPGTRFTVRRSDPTIFPVLGLSLTSDTSDTRALRQLAELKLRPVLTPVSGVAGVDVLGGSPREIAVEVDPARLQALSLTLADVAAALSTANTVKVVGKIEDRHRLYLTLVEDRIANVADLAAAPIKTGTDVKAGIVTLGEIATITPSEAPNFSASPQPGGMPCSSASASRRVRTAQLVKDIDAAWRMPDCRRM
jgi:multidrug efflux pump subunit AcrB